MKLTDSNKKLLGMLEEIDRKEEQVAEEFEDQRKQEAIKRLEELSSWLDSVGQDNGRQ